MFLLLQLQNVGLEGLQKLAASAQVLIDNAHGSFRRQCFHTHAVHSETILCSANETREKLVKNETSAAHL